MANDGGTQNSRARSGMLQKTWVKVAGAIIALLVLVVLIVPLLVNADTFRPTAENELSSVLGRRVTLGHLSFSLLSGSLVAENVAIADDPAFSNSPFFQAKSLRIGVNTSALLFHHDLQITHLIAEAPQIHLISRPNGAWNYASLGSGSGAGSSPPGGASTLAIGEFKVSNGSVDVSSIPAHGAPFVYNHVDIDVQHLSLATAMPFTISADLPANGTVKLNGTVGPVAQPNAIHTPLQASVTVKNFNPVAAGVIPPSDGVSMVADVDAKLNSDGKTLTTIGNMQAAQLKLSPQGTPAAQPVKVDLNTTSDLGAQTGRINDLAIHTGGMAAHVTGSYQVVGSAVNLNLHLDAPGLPVDGLQQLLPAVGVKLPSGSSLHGGTLTARLDIAGPAAAPRINGPVSIENTQLSGFALGSKIEGLSANPGSGGGNATQIQTLSAVVTNTPQSTQLAQINCVVPAIGAATGSGTVSAGGDLNFQLVAKLNATGGIGGAATAALGSIGGAVGNFLHSAVANGVPISVTGTTANPSIRANLGAMLNQQGGSNNTNTPSNGGILGGLGGLFNKK